DRGRLLVSEACVADPIDLLRVGARTLRVHPFTRERVRVLRHLRELLQTLYRFEAEILSLDPFSRPRGARETLGVNQPVTIAGPAMPKHQLSNVPAALPGASHERGGRWLDPARH